MATELKATETHTNLKAAFAAEAQSNLRYLYFSKLAGVSGRPDIEELFSDIAEGEAHRAMGLFDYLKRAGDPATGLAVGSSEQNLKSAILQETHESTQTYNGYAETARKDGLDDIADYFDTLARDSKENASRLQKALDASDVCQQPRD